MFNNYEKNVVYVMNEIRGTYGTRLFVTMDTKDDIKKFLKLFDIWEHCSKATFGKTEMLLIELGLTTIKGFECSEDFVKSYFFRKAIKRLGGEVVFLDEKRG